MRKIKKFLSTLAIITIFISLVSKPLEYAYADDFQNKYDPRVLNLVTNVRNQGNLGLCWDFTGMAALESYLLYKGYGEYDLSEEHCRWWCSLNEEGYGWNRNSYDGGPTQIMPGYLSSWIGVKNEEDMPYNNTYSAEKPENLDTLEGKYNVTDIVYVKNNSEDVKKAILEYGAVATTYYYSTSYLNSTTGGYSCLANNKTANHNSVIVGWDDDYSKENFKASNRPNNNGAWLIKNSWGVANGENGYIWISYEDKYVLSENSNKINYAIKDIEEVDSENTKVYQHDEYGSTSNLSLTVGNEKAQEMMYANVYDFNEEYNVLDEIMINTKSEGAKYSLYYGYVINEKPVLDKESLVLLEEGKVPHSGYITFDIKDFKLPKGKGAIVVKLDNTKNKEAVSLGCEKDIKYNSGEVAYIADANIGESYVYTGSELYDINEAFTDSKRSLTIKAITKKSSDTSLDSLLINDYEVINSLVNNEFNIELPYSYLGTSIEFKVTPSNSYSKIEELFNFEGVINIPIDGQVPSYTFTCTSPNGNSNVYKINIKVKENANISISDLPWQVDVKAEENEESFNEIQNLINNKYLLSLFDVNLYDRYTNEEYKASKEVEVILPLPDISSYKNIKVVSINALGEVETLNPTIKDNKVKVVTNSLNKIGVIALDKKSSNNEVLKVIVNEDIIENINNEINIELPYSNIDSYINVSAIPASNFSVITGLTTSIYIPLNAETQLINFVCKAEDGSEKTYTLKIAISNEIKTSKDFEKYMNNIDLTNNINKLLLVKLYEELEDNENLNENIKNNILEIKALLQKEFSKNNGVEACNLPWQVSIKADRIEETEDLNYNEEVLALYNISLYDNIYNLPYNLKEDLKIAIDLTDSMLNKNIRVISKNEDGTFEVIVPEIKDNKILFTINSLNKIGIIGIEDIKDTLIDYDNKITDDTIDIKGYPLKNTEGKVTEVKSGDKKTKVPFIFLGGISLLVIVLVIIKKHRKGE